MEQHDFEQSLIAIEASRQSVLLLFRPGQRLVHGVFRCRVLPHSIGLIACVESGLREAVLWADCTELITSQLFEEMVQDLVVREWICESRGQSHHLGLFGGDAFFAGEAKNDTLRWQCESQSDAREQLVYETRGTPEILKDSIVAIRIMEFSWDCFHQAIDPILLLKHFLTEAKDPSVAVVLLDFPLGLWCHVAPTGIMASPNTGAIFGVQITGQSMIVIVSLCGARHSLQEVSVQICVLLYARAEMMSSNARVAWLLG